MNQVAGKINDGKNTCSKTWNNEKTISEICLDCLQDIFLSICCLL